MGSRSPETINYCYKILKMWENTTRFAAKPFLALSVNAEEERQFFELKLMQL